MKLCNRIMRFWFLLKDLLQGPKEDDIWRQKERAEKIVAQKCGCKIITYEELEERRKRLANHKF